MNCKKCGNEIIGRKANARYCTISCQENRRVVDYKKPVARKATNVYAQLERLRDGSNSIGNI